jgi:hypothetical protein
MGTSMAPTEKRAYRFADDGEGVVTGPGGVTVTLPGSTNDPGMIEWLDSLADNPDHPITRADKPAKKES